MEKEFNSEVSSSLDHRKDGTNDKDPVTHYV